MNPDRLLVTAAQMQAVEDWTFNRGLPVAGLMERAGLRLTETILDTYPGLDRVGVLVGPGHNGADALVVARELHLLGLTVQVFVPVNPLKPLTQDHLRYYQAIGGRVVPEVQELRASSLLVDGLFGSGLTRALAPELAQLVDTINHWGLRVVSLDLPSGLESDTGAVLGTAIRAERTFCLGLWKQGLFEDRALEYCGTVTRLDLGLPMAALQAVLPEPQTQRITPDFARAGLPLNRPLAAHKYTVGRLLVVAGSRQFTGAALLTGLGARASGVGWVGMAVPGSIRDGLGFHLPDAVYHPCPETSEGVIHQLAVDPRDYRAVACGPGLGHASELVQQLLAQPVPLVLDAGALSSLGVCGDQLQRSAPTVITPHAGEFKRLFPDLDPQSRLASARIAAVRSGAVVVLKGARTVIATPQGQVWVNPESTPALARAGSGDVLTGLLAGVLAQGVSPLMAAVGAVWWHSHAARQLALTRSVLGVDPVTLAQYLPSSLEFI